MTLPHLCVVIVGWPDLSYRPQISSTQLCKVFSVLLTFPSSSRLWAALGGGGEVAYLTFSDVAYAPKTRFLNSKCLKFSIPDSLYDQEGGVPLITLKNQSVTVRWHTVRNLSVATSAQCLLTQGLVSVSSRQSVSTNQYCSLIYFHTMEYLDTDLRYLCDKSFWIVDVDWIPLCYSCQILLDLIKFWID